MTSKETHPAGEDNQANYEATVLDFLDKEMAAVQPAQKKEQPLDELNALVSDLLKQVITETDQPQDGSKILDENKPLFDEQDELFSGLKPDPQDAAVPSPNTAEQAQDVKPDQAPSSAVQEELERAAATPDPIFKLAKSKTAPAPAFLTGQAISKKKMPLIGAAAGLLLIIGAAIYFFSGSSSKVQNEPASQPIPAQTASAIPKPAPVPLEMQGKTAAPPLRTAKSAAPAQSGQALIAVKQPASPMKASSQTNPRTAPVQEQKSITSKDNQAPAPSMASATPPTIVREERPAAIQAVQPAAPPVTVAAVEKPAAEPVVENPAPSAPERKPAPSTPAPASVESPAAPAQPAPRNLVAAIPLSQATPAYPSLALRTRASGTVVLELQIDENGKVVKATPVSGPAIFHSAAIAAAMKWRYRPASIGGVNVRSQSRATMDFNLK